MRIGIIGAGGIAGKISQTLATRWSHWLHAVASRDQDKAREFASRYGYQRAYGSYEELVQDPLVDIVYIATPHSHHYAHARLALEHGKAVICEKAFTANAHEAQALIELARSRGLFLMEAMWTRFMPIYHRLAQVLESGIVGRPRLMHASLCWAMPQVERIRRADLCGGALLDLGVYCLTFADMFLRGNIASMATHVVKGGEDVDWSNVTSILYDDGVIATLQSSATCYDKRGIIACENGRIEVDAVNWPHEVRVISPRGDVIEQFGNPEDQITGYEYEFLAAQEALDNGWTEHPLMPHSTTLRIMRLMDSLRHEWGVIYPNDNLTP